MKASDRLVAHGLRIRVVWMLAGECASKIHVLEQRVCFDSDRELAVRLDIGVQRDTVC